MNKNIDFEDFQDVILKGGDWYGVSVVRGKILGYFICV